MTVSPIKCHHHVLQLTTKSYSRVSHCGRTALLLKPQLLGLELPIPGTVSELEGQVNGVMAEISFRLEPRSSGSSVATEINLQVHELVSEISLGTLHCH